jgi:hypothetical protein
MLQFNSSKIQFKNNKLIFNKRNRYEIFYCTDGEFITADNKILYVTKGRYEYLTLPEGDFLLANNEKFNIKRTFN